jgi:hypothetical protein
MDWKKLTMLGLVGAAIAVPIIRKKMHKTGYGSHTDTFGSLESDSVGNMGGTSPATETWSQGAAGQ